MVGAWGFGDSFALPAGRKFRRYPLHIRTEPSQYVWGLGRPQCPLEAAFVVLRHPSPRRGNKPLCDALGWFPALAPTGEQSSREALRRVGSSP